MSRHVMTRRVLVCLLGCLSLCAGAEPNAGSQRPYLGVLLHPDALPQWLFQHLDLPETGGLRIANIHLGSPADQAGLQRNDVILELDGQPVTDPNHFVARILDAEIGQVIVLEVLHHGKTKRMSITLGHRPEVFRPKHEPLPGPPIVAGRLGRIYRLDPDRRRWVEVHPRLWDPNQVQQYQDRFQEQRAQMIEALRDTLRSMEHSMRTNRLEERDDPAASSDQRIEHIERRLRHIERRLREFAERLDRLEKRLDSIGVDQPDRSDVCPM